MKYVLELILTTVIVFFVWNILKRLFVNSIFRYTRPPRREQSATSQKKKDSKSKIHWDAETVDYEEIDETKK